MIRIGGVGVGERGISAPGQWDPPGLVMMWFGRRTRQAFALL